MIRGLIVVLLLMVPLPAAGQGAGFEALASRFTAGWTVHERPGLQVIASDPERVHALGLDTLAAFVDSCLARLEAPTRVRRELRRQPIRYYLCADASEVHFLTGTATEGLALLEHRAVVTKWLPHEHELVHVLAHMTVGGDATAYEPFLQEGLATWWGGRGGEAPRVLLRAADHLLDTSGERLPNLLGRQRTQLFSDPTRAAYAVSGRLVQYLVETGGLRRFLRLYRLLGGDLDTVVERPPEWVLLQVEGTYDTTWNRLLAGFDDWRRAHPVPALGATRPPRFPATLSATQGARRVEAWAVGEGEWIFHLDGGGRFPEGLVQWGPELPSGYRPRLLSRHATGAPRRFGLSLRPSRVELFDFSLERLVATWEPPPPTFRGIGDALPAGVTVRIPAALLPEIAAPRDLVLSSVPESGP